MSHQARTPVLSPRRVARTGAAVLALSFALAGCGDPGPTQDGGSVTTASDGSQFNQADVDFVTRMIPHHAQAVQMVVMAQGRDLSEPVLALMDDIRAAQVPEIETMVDWLVAWDQPVPETSLDHANAESGHLADMDDMQGMDGMEGMMGNEEMAELESAPDGEFETLWLDMMQRHHAGAIAMAEVEVDSGHNPDAVALAEEIIETQTEEVALMDDLS